MPYNLELTFTGLTVLTFFGADKRQPREVHVLLLKSDFHFESFPGVHAHDPHYPLLSFATARNARPAAGSDAKYRLVPTPDGRQLGLANLDGEITLTLDPADHAAAKHLDARWRPADQPERQAPDDEMAWLNWVPLLQRVNPEVKDSTNVPPLAGLRSDGIRAWLKLDRGVLRAANLIGRDGKLVLWDFKTPAGQVRATQAMAAAVSLRLEGLEAPVAFAGSFGRLGLVGQRPGELVQVSITNLPERDSPPSKRLEHFAQFFQVTEFDTQLGGLALPEARGIEDTSSGSDCPPSIHTQVP